MTQERPTCDDCYFRRHGLCALALERPCPTFRAAGGILQPRPRPLLTTAQAATAAMSAFAAA